MLYICDMFSRKCPKCKSKITYNSQLTYLRAVNKNTQCGGCASYNRNPFPFTKKEFCELYYNQGLSVSEIQIKYSYDVDKIGNEGQSQIAYRIFKKFNLPKRKDVIRLRKKRFVTKYYNTCPITGETSDYLNNGDYNKAYNNLVDRFNSGNMMRQGAAFVANTPNLSIRQLRLRVLLEKHTNNTICCQCVKIKPKSDMCINRGLPRTCKECRLPKERKRAKEYAKNKRETLGKEEYNKTQREYRKNMSPEKKYEQYLKVRKWKSTQPNWGNKPMSDEERYCRRLLNLTIRVLATEKITSTYNELGYTPQELYDVVGPKIDGCDLDHKVPISWFKKGTPVNIVNSLNNLQWISSKYNRAKQNFWFDNINIEYYEMIKPYLKHTRTYRFIIEENIVIDNNYGDYIPELVLE